MFEVPYFPFWSNSLIVRTDVISIYDIIIVIILIFYRIIYVYVSMILSYVIYSDNFPIYSYVMRQDFVIVLCAI